MNVKLFFLLLLLIDHNHFIVKAESDKFMYNNNYCIIISYSRVKNRMFKNLLWLIEIKIGYTTLFIDINNPKLKFC